MHPLWFFVHSSFGLKEGYADAPVSGHHLQEGPGGDLCRQDPQGAFWKDPAEGNEEAAPAPAAAAAAASLIPQRILFGKLNNLRPKDVHKEDPFEGAWILPVSNNLLCMFFC
jgi:hypothetical protein